MQKRKQSGAPSAPECERMLAVKDQSQAIGQFIDWLYSEKKWELCARQEHKLFPVSLNIEQLLAEYFGIDLKKVEEERRAILDFLRKNG